MPPEGAGTLGGTGVEVVVAASATTDDWRMCDLIFFFLLSFHLLALCFSPKEPPALSLPDP